LRQVESARLAVAFAEGGVISAAQQVGHGLFAHAIRRTDVHQSVAVSVQFQNIGHIKGELAPGVDRTPA